VGWDGGGDCGDHLDVLLGVDLFRGVNTHFSMNHLHVILKIGTVKGWGSD
jgi:hypothetical protein